MVAQAIVITPKHKQTFEVHRLSDEQVASVRAKWATGSYTQKQLALEFKVSVSCINSYVNFKRRVNNAVSYKRGVGLLDKQEHVYVYGFSGEQVAVVENEQDAEDLIEANKLVRRNALLREQRELEARIRAIQNEIADLDGIPF